MSLSRSGRLNVLDNQPPLQVSLAADPAVAPARQAPPPQTAAAPLTEQRLDRLRTSSYVIYVDIPNNSEDMLLVHGYTGAHDRVSRKVATYLRSLESRRAPKPLYGDWTPEPPIDGVVEEPPENAIEVLKERGYLTDKTREAELEHFQLVVEKFHNKAVNMMPRYMFMPTYNCNLRCSYCFQDHMRTDPKFQHLLKRIRPEDVDRVYGAMPKIETMHGLQGDEERHRSIGFFGGEPFLEDNRPIVEHIINRTLEAGTGDFWAVSNATQLHAYEDLLSPELISSIQITLDGPPEEHDQRRIHADGSGSFDQIARNISMALDRGVEIEVRMNIDRNNIGSLPKLGDEIIARGWDQYPKFVAYTAPIRAQNDKTERKTTFNTWQLAQAMTEMRAEFPHLRFIRKADEGYKRTAQQVFERPGEAPITVRESFCTAHSRLYIFDAVTDIYTCWDHTGDARVRIGRITEEAEVELNTPVHSLWRSRTVASNPVCSQCRYALHCGGGCAALAMTATGKFHANFCDGFANRFRSSIADAYLDFTNGVSSESCSSGCGCG